MVTIRPDLSSYNARHISVLSTGDVENAVKIMKMAIAPAAQWLRHGLVRSRVGQDSPETGKTGGSGQAFEAAPCGTSPTTIRRWRAWPIAGGAERLEIRDREYAGCPGTVPLPDYAAPVRLYTAS